MKIIINDVKSSLADSIFPKYYLHFSKVTEGGMIQDMDNIRRISSKQFDELVENHGCDLKGKIIEVKNSFVDV